MTRTETSSELAADYWNSPETVAGFSALDAQPYLIELLRQTPVEGVALDLGCGGGRNTLALLRRGFTTVALDLHSGMVEATRARTGEYGEQVAVRQGAAHAIDAPDASFALVVCYGVLHNAVDHAQWSAAVSEIARVLRPDGLLALNCFTSRVLDPQLRQDGAEGRYLLPDGVPMTLLPPDRVLRAFADAGLTPEGAVHDYVRQLDVGPRAVLRCTLRREGH